MPVRPLSKELQAKAISDLSEDPKRLPEDIKYIKKWLSQQQHIVARTDDQWLVAFLRGCKFSLERTKEKLDTFYTMRTIVPEFFKNRDPLLPELQKILEVGIYLPLPNSEAEDTPRVIMYRSGVYDAHAVNPNDLFKVNMMIQDIILMENDGYVICGGQIMQDMADVTIAHMAQMSMTMTKKAMTIFQDAYPVRPKGIHFTNIPTFFETMYAMFKPFLKEKMLKRMNIHTGKNLDEMYKVIPQRLLPKEYGGEAPPVAEIAAYWKKKVESYRDWFLDDEKYHSIESKRPGKPKTTENVFGLEGSFRKLNVD